MEPLEWSLWDGLWDGSDGIAGMDPKGSILTATNITDLDPQPP
jgi:hypothetical protein